MANTRFLATQVEDFVRARLTDEYGVPFSKRFLELATAGRRKHEFDAVSEHGEIVASIKATSARTSGGNLPQGKFNNAIAELYYLSLVEAPKRLLVLTDPAFYELLRRKIDGALPTGVSIECIRLSAEMQAQVDEVVRAASKEMAPQVAAEIVAEGEIT